MQVKRISYGRTYNLGNYQSERIDIEAAVDKDEQAVVDILYIKLRNLVETAHKRGGKKQ